MADSDDPVRVPINNQQLFEDILNGVYDENGFEIYRVFRDT